MLCAASKDVVILPAAGLMARLEWRLQPAQLVLRNEFKIRHETRKKTASERASERRCKSSDVDEFSVVVDVVVAAAEFNFSSTSIDAGAGRRIAGT